MKLVILMGLMRLMLIRLMMTRLMSRGVYIQRLKQVLQHASGAKTDNPDCTCGYVDSRYPVGDSLIGIHLLLKILLFYKKKPVESKEIGIETGR